MTTADAPTGFLRRGRPWLSRHPYVRAFLTAPSGLVGLFTLLFVIGVAIFAPMFLTTKSEELDVVNIYSGPSLDHLLGTDLLGRDVLARLAVATRLSVFLGLGAAVISIAIGLVLGVLTSVVPPRYRTVLTRTIDALVSFPHLLLAIFITTIIGVGVAGALIGVGIAFAFTFARITSSLALSVGGREYVNAARVIGIKPRRLMVRYIFPNIAEPLFIAMFVKISFSLLAVSSLSFLGLGVQSPNYDWGRMLTEGVQAIYIQPAAALGPAAAIAITAMAFGFFGEALARAANPKLWVAEEGKRPAPAVGGGATSAPLPAVTTAPGRNGDARRDRETVLRVTDLVVSFPRGRERVNIVKGVSFTVEKGEIVGIVGESGSGKTMTALAIAQLTRYPGEVGGTIELDGDELQKLRPSQLSKLMAKEVAVIFQDPSSSLNPALKIGAQMTMGIRVHRRLSRREARRLAADRLREVHISGPERQLERHAHELSGGMQQRVMIATGLMAEPSLLIADEPTTALDVTVQAQIMDLMNEINTTRAAAVVLISHNLALVSQNCHRVIVMYAGRIVEDIETAKLLEGPSHPYTRALLGAIPQLGHSRDLPLANIPGETPNITNPPPGCPYHPRCPLAVSVCRNELPPLLRRPEGDRVACHVANEDIASHA